MFKKIDDINSIEIKKIKIGKKKKRKLMKN